MEKYVQDTFSALTFHHCCWSSSRSGAAGAERLMILIKCDG